MITELKKSICEKLRSRSIVLDSQQDIKIRSVASGLNSDMIGFWSGSNSAICRSQYHSSQLRWANHELAKSVYGAEMPTGFIYCPIIALFNGRSYKKRDFTPFFTALPKVHDKKNGNKTEKKIAHMEISWNAGVFYTLRPEKGPENTDGRPHPFSRQHLSYSSVCFSSGFVWNMQWTSPLGPSLCWGTSLCN